MSRSASTSEPLSAELAPRLKLYARVLQGQEIVLGPGKADLLDAISRDGSITAAAKTMGLSYRRAWLMVDSMNKGFREPLVAAAHGGLRGGGAAVTPFGLDILKRYRTMQTEIEALAARHFKGLKPLLKPSDS
ncbi:winged helix-turn-helix domain-containing protein [Govanella unica]|uniref:LysR family transcriptional regulator n=1 Tax=Govanella unica TaxID=2975056 RepID=A0A9X3Z6T3_9PROT|nr:LysR family transcriptional regulator [Govania unica]MDA5193442.1 LysR family transcriptional regulator [Govania unica]